MKNDDLYRILLKGGVTSPGELKDIILMLEKAGLKEVFFGSRQDLLFPMEAVESQDQLEALSPFNTDIVINRDYQNIVSSYVSADIFEMTYWLKGSTYLYILEGFEHRPKLKINITDPKQRLVPLFSGNLNFVASESEDYWYLHLKLPHWKNSAFYPVLIYTWDISAICKLIEDIHEDIPDVDELFFVANTRLDANNKIIEKELKIPYLTFPYYEGVNRMGIDQYWLGLYWRNNKYDLAFLKDFCGFCLDNSIGKVCITPWKSFIVKGIKQSSRAELERFLGQKGINIRHSQLEMNWHVPVDDEEALALKQFLVRSFDQNDISTYGLTFGISDDVGKRSHFSSIVIEKNSAPTLVQDFEVRPTYNVLHCENFDPNTRVYLTHAQDVDKIELPGLLMELSKKYFEQLGKVQPFEKKTVEADEREAKTVYQCQSCFSVYDKQFGDEKAGVPIGTEFENVPESYVCTVCDSPKMNFIKTELQINGV